MPVSSLTTRTPADGQRLARQLADEMLASLPDATPATAPAMLRTDTARRPDTGVITAIYFHAITLANQGWRS